MLAQDVVLTCLSCPEYDRANSYPILSKPCFFTDRSKGYGGFSLALQMACSKRLKDDPQMEPRRYSFTRSPGSEVDHEKALSNVTQLSASKLELKIFAYSLLRSERMQGFLADPVYGGRSFRLCWDLSEPEGPKGPKDLKAYTT